MKYNEKCFKLTGKTYNKKKRQKRNITNRSNKGYRPTRFIGLTLSLYTNIRHWTKLIEFKLKLYDPRRNCFIHQKACAID